MQPVLAAARHLKFGKESVMFNLISSPIQANTLRLCFYLALAGLLATSYKAKSEEGLFASSLDVATLQSAISNTAGQHAYRMSAIIALERSENFALSDTGHANPLPLQGVTGQKQETLWQTDEHWKIAPLNERISLSALLRYESKEDRITIKPQRHSIRFEWRKSFP
jgi:hypothetical protein